MKKFDKLLDKLFHSKLGIIATIAIALFAVVFAYGCSCSFGGFYCNDEVCGYHASDLEKCFGGYDKECSRDCSNDLVIYVMYQDATEIGYITLKESALKNGNAIIPKYASSSLNNYITNLKDSPYYQLKGYFINGNMVISSEGLVTDEKTLKSAVSNNTARVSLTTYEKNAGEEILVNFTSNEEGLIMNPVFVVIGAAIESFPSPIVEGKTFIGWRVKGTNNAPVMLKTGDVFHLSSLNIGMQYNITLEAVFE